MPTYEYACGSCGGRYEKREGFDAPARQKCRDCGKATAQRVLFAPPVVFKGSGFYKTDSRGSDSGSSSAPSESPAPAASTDAGHGHSHGAGGHSHGTETTPKADDKKTKTTTTTETAAAS